MAFLRHWSRVDKLVLADISVYIKELGNEIYHNDKRSFVPSLTGQSSYS